MKTPIVLSILLFSVPAFAGEENDRGAPPSAPAQVVNRLPVPGNPDAFFVEPRGDGEQAVLLVLHPRHGAPAADCAKWAGVGSPHGWVLCPAGPVGTDGDRSWGKFDDAKRVIDATMEALRAKFGARVRQAHNVIIGFSEGALMGQILGLRAPEQWSRWPILAGSDTYWGDDEELSFRWLRMARPKLGRVVFLTGEHDPIVENTLRAGALVRGAHIPVRVIIRRGLGHEVREDRMASYQASLRWIMETP